MSGMFVPSGVTPWVAYNTPRIWAMVASEDNAESWQQVAALASMGGLINDQRKRLIGAKQALVEAWPPEQNAAARAFVELIDDLLFNMQKNKEIADTNADALTHVLEELSSAKKDIAPIHDAYLQKSDDWVPAWWDSAEDELDDKARDRMRRAEVAIAQPGNAITAPPLYELKPVYTRTKVDDEPGSRGSGGQSPGSGLSRSEAAANDFVVPHDPPPPLPGHDASGPPTTTPAIPAGPGLAGVVAPPPPVSGNPVTSLPSSGSPIVSTGGGLVIGGSLPLGAPSQRTGTARGGSGRAASGTVGGFGPQGRGGTAANKPTTPSWLPPAAGQPARGGSGPGRAGSGMSPTPAPMTGARRSEGRRDGNPSFDPDNPWETAEGVAPVIEPSRREHYHDPGPGVIGWQE